MLTYGELVIKLHYESKCDFYMKRKIIMTALIVLTLTFATVVFAFYKNRNVYITNVENIDNMKLSMIKIEEGISTVIKEVPQEGNWYMDYNCENNKTKLYWDNDNRKILIKEISNTECTVRFEKTKSAINVVSMYVDDIYVGELEENKSYRLLSYECANGETVEWHGIRSSVEVYPLRQNTHCKLYFEEAPYLYNRILLDNVAQSDASINFANPSSETNGKGLYYTADDITYGEDLKRIYYYRGRVENNWVSFGGYLWRIVRTTSEDGIKLAYSGDGLGTSSAFINTALAFNSSYNNKHYVGYTWNTSGYTSSPQTNSTIKGVVDTWYNTNLSSYASYLSDTAVYCNDRSSERIDGSNIFYPAYDRVITNKRPTHACPSVNGSRYTVSTETGNGYLSNPIALLSADEASYAGLVYGTNSLNSYIMDHTTGVSYWWLLSPYHYRTYAISFLVSSSGSFDNYYVNNTNGVRPSVSLKSCITVTEGDGRISTPYVLSDKAC